MDPVNITFLEENTLVRISAHESGLKSHLISDCRMMALDLID
jgi:hypothetical protein